MESNQGGEHSSLYSLMTLDKVQSHLRHHLGKPLLSGSMNLDDLLKSVYSGHGDDSHVAINMMNKDLGKKTVDQVRRDIHNKENLESHGTQPPTLGEVTLEDFLTKAAATHLVAEPENKRKQYQYQQEQDNVMANHALNSLVDASTSSSPFLMGDALSDTQTLGISKRIPPREVAEKTVERRQKRMIKNRESAARSRARKQAYTNELENKVSRLEEENEKLRKQTELERMLHCATPPEPKYQLRRTSSSSF